MATPTTAITRAVASSWFIENIASFLSIVDLAGATAPSHLFRDAINDWVSKQRLWRPQLLKTPLRRRQCRFEDDTVATEQAAAVAAAGFQGGHYGAAARPKRTAAAPPSSRCRQRRANAAAAADAATPGVGAGRARCWRRCIAT